ncbi:FecR family protein [Dyadobacter koreensis]|uniref:FecR family protein n=1 Tax=Dyadobacter koreensis TaxID=408657 RepID=A0A1H6Q407_9BACT|nr:FecR domain-containing protein [Dyadobacter koreensis]SEI38558.1 FecR family protein [Dyadobacter koreensis]
MKGLITKEFLFDFFDGKTTSIQRKLIEDWLKNTSNEEMFYSCVDEWERLHPQFSPDRPAALKEYELLLEGNGEYAAKYSPFSDDTTNRNFFSKPRVWCAAVVSLLLLTTFIFRDNVFFKIYTSPVGQTSGFFLTDSTHVTLNSKSTLKVPRFGFGSDVRQVQLHGEAEFRVTHLQNNLRFRVLMGEGYQIEVLGTEFTAFARASGKRVFLSKGKVKLELPEGKRLYMKPGSYFSANAGGDFKVTVPKETLAITAWKEQTFYFDNTQLSEVARQIQERFDVRVKIPDKNLAKTCIGGIYKARDADELFEILSALLEIEITQKSDCIELRTTKSYEL